MMAATAIPTMNSWLWKADRFEIEHVHLHDAMSRFSFEVASPSAVNLHRLRCGAQLMLTQN